MSRYVPDHMQTPMLTVELAETSYYYDKQLRDARESAKKHKRKGKCTDRVAFSVNPKWRTCYAGR